MRKQVEPKPLANPWLPEYRSGTGKVLVDGDTVKVRGMRGTFTFHGWREESHRGAVAQLYGGTYNNWRFVPVHEVSKKRRSSQ